MPNTVRRDVFQAIADPNRRLIIDILLKESLSINALSERFEISRPAVSQHIKLLVECGVGKSASIDPPFPPKAVHRFRPKCPDCSTK